MILEQRKTEIETKFQTRMELVGAYGTQIQKEIRKLDRETGLAVRYLYATMPLSDIADYEFRIFEDYARQGIFLWNHGKFSRSIPEDLFLNYVLYHRVNEEDITVCRSFFYSQIEDEINADSMKETILNLNYWCAREATYRSTDERTAGPMTVYRSAYGRCGEESTFTVSVLRSAGIPARQVYAPRWSHCDDNHAWVEVWCDGEWYFLGACEPEEILNRGWFTNAASRAMMIHSRWFDYKEGADEFCGKEGCVTLHNQLKRYADTRTLQVTVVDAEQMPVAGAAVDFEVLNYCEFVPVASLETGADGTVSLTTGKGTVHLHVHKGDCYQEKVVDSGTVQATVILSRESRNEPICEEFDMIAPPDTPVHTECPSNGQKLRGAIRLKHAVRHREEKVNGFVRDTEVLEESRGNYPEIKKLMESQEPLAEKIWQVLSKKDYRDCKSSVLLEHIQESRAFEQDYEPDIFASYVLSPRIYMEPLTTYRKELKSCFDEKTRAAFHNDPVKIWDYIQQTVEELPEEEFPHLTTSPMGVMKIKKAGSLSKKILFTAICRTFGIAARINEETLAAEYYRGGVFVPVEKGDEKTEQLRLVSEDTEVIWKYGENWTLAKLTNGVFRTLKLQNLNWDNGVLCLPLAKGTYRLITGNRLPNGNIFAVKQVVALGDGQEKELPVLLRKAQLSDILEEIAVNDFEVRTEHNELVCAESLLRGKDSIVIFLEEGKEPTEHILNELYENSSDLNQMGIPIYLIVRGEEAFQNPALQRTMGRLENVRFYFDDFTNLPETLARRMYVEPEKFPLVIVFKKGLTGVYAASGYNVGTGEMLLKIVRNLRK